MFRVIWDIFFYVLFILISVGSIDIGKFLALLIVGISIEIKCLSHPFRTWCSSTASLVLAYAGAPTESISLIQLKAGIFEEAIFEAFVAEANAFYFIQALL